jgi:cytidine deaminase
LSSIVRDEDLISAAREVRGRAYAPYSKFSVGAAVLTKGGKIVTGCNVENSSYGLSMCAERTAIFRAIAEGEKEFNAIAIAGPDGVAVTPCGACRQVMWEFARELIVLTLDEHGKIVRRTIRELLPGAFGPDMLV